MRRRLNTPPPVRAAAPATIRSLGLALALGLGLAPWAVAGAVETENACAPLTVPAELGLDCRSELRPTGRALIIEPETGSFQALSRLTLRKLDPVADRPAWTAPRNWLEQQMILDVGALSAALDSVGSDPDSPFGSDMIKSGIAMLVDGLDELSRLPLSACGEPVSDSAIDCRFGVEPFMLLMRVSLVTAGEARYAINIRTFNEQRLRHFDAIANSFVPADSDNPAP